MQVRDNDGNPVAAQILTDLNGNVVVDSVTGAPMIAPLDLDPADVIAEAQLTPVQSLPSYLSSFYDGGINDSQRTYNGVQHGAKSDGFVKSFTDAAAYKFGLAAAAAGIPKNLAILGGGVVNMIGAVNQAAHGKFGQLLNASPLFDGNNPDRVKSIDQGYADYNSGRWGNQAPPSATIPNPLLDLPGFPLLPIAYQGPNEDRPTISNLTTGDAGSNSPSGGAEQGGGGTTGYNSSSGSDSPSGNGIAGSSSNAGTSGNSTSSADNGVGGAGTPTASTPTRLC